MTLMLPRSRTSPGWAVTFRRTSPVLQSSVGACAGAHEDRSLDVSLQTIHLETAVGIGREALVVGPEAVGSVGQVDACRRKTS